MQNKKNNIMSLYLDDERREMIDLLRGKTKKSTWVLEQIDKAIKRNMDIVDDLTAKKMSMINDLLQEHGEEVTRSILETKFDIKLPSNFFKFSKGVFIKKREKTDKGDNIDILENIDNTENIESTKDYYEGDMKKYEGGLCLKTRYLNYWKLKIYKN